ncbi:PREDICTED: mucin-5AC isoform X2 [Drosophila arizonae]|uniref:Mucin-5AC isoform X2 n=1 Tax=Drosophila arizonae TaxID=7263 RepID=A0ABM1PUG6_DROAR|nr:PREDICTED: mucin-5AC isoform X2 [Drosophila arizonae]
MLPFRRGATWQTLFFLCALAYCINVASGEGRVVCYYTNWSVYRPGTAKFNPQNINPYLCTHLVYAFGGFTKDNQMKPFDKYQDIEQGGYAKFTGLKTYNKQLKTMIAIGGWNEASSRFSPLVASADRRQQFIKNILKFLRQNHFDGIDLDWEYPAHREGGKPRDRDNYAQFVQELRAEFEREAEKTGRSRLLLTMAVPAGIEYIDKGYDVPKLNKYLDWFNVLTYDFHSSHEPSVNHHAPLYSLEDDSEYNYDAELNIDYSIKYYLKAGADRDKLVLGIPTYGRSYTLINEESTELGAPSEGPGEQGDATREKGYLAYYEICQTLKEDSEWTVVQPNPNVMGPYAYRRNQWVGYDDEAIVRKKAEYVVAHGLGGIMFWAIDNDDFRGTCTGKPYPLIEAAKEAMFDAYGLGINEVAKSVGPQKPLRSRSRENGITSTRKHLNSESESSSRGSSAARRPGSRGSTTTTPAPTTIRLTEPKGSSLYIGGRGSTTPAPPTTPDPGSDFKCEEEGFFQHPRDCKKYYWCLDSGPSGLGIVAHQFTCPSGLYFNPAADSCDFARNVPCKTKKSTTAAPVTSTSTTTSTTPRPTSSYNRVTAAPVARPVFPRVTSTTTTTTAAPVEDELEYEEDGDNTQTSNKSSDAEEDPQVIKELIDLIRKVGGIEQLEKHLLRNKDGSITLKENFSNGAPTTPSTISKSLYDRVLNRPETLGTFSRNRFSAAKVQTTESSVADDSSSQAGNSKYSSVLRGNSRQGPQNEGLEKLPEFDGFLKERKQYVTINRNRGVSRDDEESEASSKDDPEASEEEEAEQKSEQILTTRRPISSATPSYTSLRRSRPTTTTSSTPVDSVTESEQTFAVREQTQTKQYATLNRNRGRSTERPQSIVSEPEVSSITNRYKYLERTRPTKSSADASVGIDDASEHDTEEDEDEYEDEPQQKNVTVPRNKSNTTATTNTRKYASIGRRTTTTTTTVTTPETTTTTTSGTGAETAKANNNNNHNRSNTVKINNVAATTPAPLSTQPDITTATATIINETTEPIESTINTNIQTTSTTNTHSPTPTPTPTTTPTTTTTPTVASTIQVPTTNSIDSLSLAEGINDMLELPLSTLPPAEDSSDEAQIPALDLKTNKLTEAATPTPTATETTTQPELVKTAKNDDKDDDDSDNQINNLDNEVTTTPATKTLSKYTTSRRRNNNRNRDNIAAAAAAINDASPNVGNSPGLSRGDPSVNSIRNSYSGRRQPPQRTKQPELKTTELPLSPTNTDSLGGISSPRPFGYPRRRTRPTATKPQPITITTNRTVNNNDNDSDSENKTQIDDVASVGKTRQSTVDRPKNRYQVSRTRGTTTTTTPRATASTTAATANTRRLSFGSRSRAQVTKLSIVGDESSDDEADDDDDDDDDNGALAKRCSSHMLLAAIGWRSLQPKITSLACSQQIFQLIAEATATAKANSHKQARRTSLQHS